MITYRGYRLQQQGSVRGITSEVRVTVSLDDGEPCPLNPRLDLRNHSPTGFEWGYGGSGPAQLALAICADALGERKAQQVYQRFKEVVVAGLPYDGWTLTEEDVQQVVEEMESA